MPVCRVLVCLFTLSQRFFIGFDWSKLTKGSIVVDVGGGIGFAAASIADGFPDLHYVVQDLPGAIANAKEVSFTFFRFEL